MKLKRILAALLTAAALLSLALPAAASGGSFSDINDHSTAVNVDVLRLMGAVSGDSDGTFRPNDVLTRAQFCTMLVGLLRQQSKVPMYTTRTIFSDVTASHWARGYINLAASITVGWWTPARAWKRRRWPTPTLRWSTIWSWCPS